MDCDINASKYRCLGLSGYPASSCFAIFHSIVPSAEIQSSGLLESRALKFGMFLCGVPAGPAEPAEPAGSAGPRARGLFGLVGDLSPPPWKQHIESLRSHGHQEMLTLLKLVTNY